MVPYVGFVMLDFEIASWICLKIGRSSCLHCLTEVDSIVVDFDYPMYSRMIDHVVAIAAEVGVQYYFYHCVCTYHVFHYYLCPLGGEDSLQIYLNTIQYNLYDENEVK